MKESIGDNSCAISFFCISLFASHNPHLIDALKTCCFIILFSNWHLCSSSTHIHVYSCSLQRTFDMFLPIAPDKKFNALFSLHPLTMKVTLFPQKWFSQVNCSSIWTRIFFFFFFFTTSSIFPSLPLFLFWGVLLLSNGQGWQRRKGANIIRVYLGLEWYVIHTTSIKPLNNLTIPVSEVMKHFPRVQGAVSSGPGMWTPCSFFPFGHTAFYPKFLCIAGQSPIQNVVAAAVRGKVRKQSQAAPHEEW